MDSIRYDIIDSLFSRESPFWTIKNLFKCKFIATSDMRLKDNIEPISDALSKVNALTGYTFTYEKDGRQSAGFLAQEVEEVLPSAVANRKLPLQKSDDNEYKTLEYNQTIALLV